MVRIAVISYNLRYIETVAIYLLIYLILLTGYFT